MALQIRFQWRVAVCGINGVCLLHFVRNHPRLYWQRRLQSGLERTFLDHHPFCIGKCHCQKFHPGKQGEAPVLLFHCKSAGHHSFKNHLQYTLNVTTQRTGTNCLPAFFPKHYWRPFILFFVGIIRQHQLFHRFYHDIGHRIQSR